MPAATDHLRGSLWTAILRRRAPQWLLAIAPLAIAAYLLPVSGTIPAASASGAASAAAVASASAAASTAAVASASAAASTAAVASTSAAAGTAAVGISSAAIGLAAAIVLCIIWIIADALRWRSRINQQWPSWLNEAIPQLEDSSTLLAEDAKGDL